MPSGSASFPIGQRALAQGQSLFEKMPRGTVIRVASGSVLLVQRIALDYGLLASRVTLRRGAVHCVQVSDWLEILAQSDAELVMWVPPPLFLRSSLMSVWRALGGRLKHGALACTKPDDYSAAVSARGENQVRINVPRIFAIGDIVSPPTLAHKAGHEAHDHDKTLGGGIEQLLKRDAHYRRA